MADPAYRTAAYQRGRARLLGAPCHRCGRPSTTADHVPALMDHAHREGSGCCLLLPACLGCNSGDGARRGNARRRRARLAPSRDWYRGAVLTVAALAVLAVVAGPARPAAAATRADCAGIVAEFRRQGAPPAVAARFGRIAWHESGCQLRCVVDRDDRSCSRLGLNMAGAMPRYWGRVCGATSPAATRPLRTDVRCALAAYRGLGWRPWR